MHPSLHHVALWDVAKWDRSSWSTTAPFSDPQNYSVVAPDAHFYAIRMRASIGPTIANGTFDFAVFDMATFDAVESAEVIFQINNFVVLVEYGAMI